MFTVGREQAEQWQKEVSLAWDEGRIDPVSIFHKVMRSKSTAVVVDAGTPSPSAVGLRADKMEQKLDSIRESLRTNTSVNSTMPSPPIIINTPSQTPSRYQPPTPGRSPHQVQKFRDQPKNKSWRKQHRH
jgi:hypothetical protein